MTYQCWAKQFHSCWRLFLYLKNLNTSWNSWIYAPLLIWTVCSCKSCIMYSNKPKTYLFSSFCCCTSCLRFLLQQGFSLGVYMSGKVMLRFAFYKMTSRNNSRECISRPDLHCGSLIFSRGRYFVLFQYKTFQEALGLGSFLLPPAETKKRTRY